MAGARHKRARSESIRTPKARLSFPSLTRPREDDNGNKKFEVTLLFPPGTDLSELKKAYRDVAMEAFNGEKPPGFKSPFRKAEEKAHIKGYDDGWIFVYASSKRPPGLVDQKVRAVTDEFKFYAGCYVYATINAYSYDYQGNRGVTFGLNNVQFAHKGEPLGGGSRAEDDFEEIEDIDGDEEPKGEVAPGEAASIFE